ncbi:MAG: hypothetical protein WC603_01655 [Candidatus Paceibacterota bacterium]|jgi:hypothetical protein
MTDVNRLLFCDARGPMNQINDVLAGKNGKLWLKGINSYLRQGAIKAFGWETYGAFDLRFFESPDVLMAAIKFKLKPRDVFWGNEHDIEVLINQINYPVLQESGVEFVSLKIEELGFEKGARLSEIEDCLPGLGLEICRQSDAPGLFLTDKDSLDKIRKIERGVFISKPFFLHLRGKNDPERPILFELTFSNVVEVGLHSFWSEATEGVEEKYPSDIFFTSSQKIVLRIK